MASTTGNLCYLTSFIRSYECLLVDIISAILLSKKHYLAFLIAEWNKCQSFLAPVHLYNSSALLHLSFYYSLDWVVTVMDLALASQTLVNTLESASESKSRLAIKPRSEKLKAWSLILTKERKAPFSLLLCLRTFLLKQIFSGEIKRLTNRGV